jgi:hypothetical protein
MASRSGGATIAKVGRAGVRVATGVRRNYRRGLPAGMAYGTGEDRGRLACRTAGQRNLAL